MRVACRRRGALGGLRDTGCDAARGMADASAHALGRGDRAADHTTRDARRRTADAAADRFHCVDGATPDAGRGADRRLRHAAHDILGRRHGSAGDAARDIDGRLTDTADDVLGRIDHAARDTTLGPAGDAGRDTAGRRPEATGHRLGRIDDTARGTTRDVADRRADARADVLHRIDGAGRDTADDAAGRLADAGSDSLGRIERAAAQASRCTGRGTTDAAGQLLGGLDHAARYATDLGCGDSGRRRGSRARYIGRDRAASECRRQRPGQSRENVAAFGLEQIGEGADVEAVLAHLVGKPAENERPGDVEHRRGRRRLDAGRRRDVGDDRRLLVAESEAQGLGGERADRGRAARQQSAEMARDAAAQGAITQQRPELRQPARGSALLDQTTEHGCRRRLQSGRNGAFRGAGRRAQRTDHSGSNLIAQGFEQARLHSVVLPWRSTFFGEVLS